jgi:hypothetical protein
LDVVEALFADLEIPARVEVLPEPRLRGAGDALDKDLVASIVESNPMEDLFLLIVDRDCDRRSNVAKAKARDDVLPSRTRAGTEEGRRRSSSRCRTEGGAAD